MAKLWKGRKTGEREENGKRGRLEREGVREREN